MLFMQMKPNIAQRILLSSLIIVLVVMLSSQVMAQSSANQNATTNTTGKATTNTTGKATTNTTGKATTNTTGKATTNTVTGKATPSLNSQDVNCTLGSTTSKNPIVENSFAVAGLVAGIIIVVVTFAASRIIREGKKWLLGQGQLVLETNCKQGNHKGGFWDIIREGDYFPSLARLQFVLWTFTISFTLLSIYLFMLWNNTLCWSVLPQNILALMGISASVPVVSTVISREKYMSSIRGSLPCKENVPALSTMLLEHGKPTLGRYQLFIWTIISIIVYLGIFFAGIAGISTAGGLAQMKLADIPLPLLALMTTSQGAYLGLKAVARPVSFLTKVGSVPAPNQKNIKISTDVVVNFSESLDSTSVNNLNFLVRKHTDTTQVAGSVTVLAEDDKMVVFHPTTDLEPGTAYDVTILTAIQSKDKNSLEKDETWSFETEKATSLSIVGRYPVQNMTNLKKSTDVVVNFSESLDSTTVNKLNFIVKKHSDGTNVEGDIKVSAEDDKIAVFNPTTDLEPGTAYDVTILTAIQSKDKNSLEKDETWSFETATS